MSDPQKKNATYDDLVDLPDNVVGEIVDGMLYATPRPRVAHAMLQVVLCQQVQAAFGGRGGTRDDRWWFLSEPELHLCGQIVVPDLGGWRHDRTPVLAGEAPWLDIAPDWICEILSPSTARLDRVHKLPVYARAGVEYAWLVDPAARTLEVLRRGERGWVIVGTDGDDARVHPEPFDAAEFDLGEWWMDATGG